MHKKYFIVCFILSIFITSTSSAQSKNILGLDSNKDGIRDDVAKWLVDHKDDYTKSVIKQLENLYKRLIRVYSLKTDNEKADYSRGILYSKSCIIGLASNNVSFAFKQYRLFIKVVFNTKERMGYYERSQPEINKQVFQDKVYLELVDKGNYIKACALKTFAEKPVVPTKESK